MAKMYVHNGDHLFVVVSVIFFFFFSLLFLVCWLLFSFEFQKARLSKSTWASSTFNYNSTGNLLWVLLFFFYNRNHENEWGRDFRLFFPHQLFRGPYENYWCELHGMFSALFMAHEVADAQVLGYPFATMRLAFRLVLLRNHHMCASVFFFRFGSCFALLVYIKILNNCFDNHQQLRFVYFQQKSGIHLIFMTLGAFLFSYLKDHFDK